MEEGVNAKSSASEDAVTSNGDNQNIEDEAKYMASPKHDGESKHYLLPQIPYYLHKVVVYETKTRFYLVGSNRKKTLFRMIKIDRTDPVELNINEDHVSYTKQQMQELLTTIDEGNKTFGGLKKTCTAYGIVGLVRFLHGYHLLLITKRRKVGEIAGHFIYGIDDTAYVYIPHPSVVKAPTDSSDETKYKALFFGMDLTKDFYFSYSYDLTHTLQYNMTNHHTYVGEDNYNSKFVWNHFLMEKFVKATSPKSIWIVPIIHGYFAQSKFAFHGKSISIVLIARRSRFFAGTRFLKRGVNEQGYVANDVETEQIVVSHDSPQLRGVPTSYCPHMSSFTQVRGSIPLYWGQDTSMMSPKPTIMVTRIDPFYSSTILHFQDLFQRYGGKVVVLNLVKAEEKRPRETILSKELAAAIEFLNSLLPPENHVIYKAFDFRKAHKSKTENMMTSMEALAQECIRETGFFHTGKKLYCNTLRERMNDVHDIPWQQMGITRTNCIDSLDRTNAAQFCVGKCALGHQLYAMGMLDAPFLGFDSELVDLLISMYEGMGNQIALQYAGSELVNTIKTYRAGTLVSHSRDLFTTVKRYYSNSFTDAEKQDSINLFLGNFVPYKEKESLWELESDFHLHNKEIKPEHFLLSNTKWWEVPLAEFTDSAKKRTIEEKPTTHGELFFSEFYQPDKITSFDALFKLQFNNTHIAKLATEEDPADVVNRMKQSNVPREEVKYGTAQELSAPIIALNTSSEDVQFFKKHLDLEELRSTTNYVSDIKDYSKNVSMQYVFPKAFTAPEDFANHLSQCRKIQTDIEVDPEDRKLYESQIWDKQPWED